MASRAETVAPLAQKRAAEAAYQALLEQILGKALAPGMLLQERRLADGLGVSRTPLREALSRLEGEGLVVRQQGRALMIKPITIDDYLDALHVRSLLEPEAAAQACGRIAPDQVAELQSQVENLLKDPAPSPDRHWAVDDAVHEAIAAAGGSDLMAGIIRNVRRRTRIFNLTRMPDRFAPGCHEHLAILGAIASGDGPAAREAMAAHLENVKASIIRKLTDR